MNWFRLRMAAAVLVSPVVPLVGCGSQALPSSDDEIPVEVQSLQDEGLRANALTREEERVALKLIDDICGDTWCEGDYNFRFHRLFCDRDVGVCSLVVQKLAYDEGPQPPFPRWTVCRTPGFTGFDSLVETSSGGYQSLHGEYYDAVSACMSKF